MVQQIMSAKSMPVLSGAVPSFKIFMSQWEKLRTKYPALKPWVNVSLKWAERYYTHIDNTNAYVVTMCDLLLSSLSNLNLNSQHKYCSQPSLLPSTSHTPLT